MFFKNNQNLLIGTAVAGILWLILYYTLVSTNWTTAADNRSNAEERRQTWINISRSKDTEKHADERKNAFLPREAAEKRIKKNSDEVAIKQGELKGIEFGNSESLKAFSVAAAGKGGDPSNLLNDKIKQAVLRANAQLKVQISSEKIAPDSEQTVSVNLLRMALLDRFLTACKDAGIEQIVQVRYGQPDALPPPVITKEDPDAENTTKRPARYSEKEKEKEKGPEVEKLIQFPMKALVRAQEKNAGQLLFELEKPTPTQQSPGENRGYFCVRGFHISAKDPALSLVEMSVGISALVRESDVKGLGIKLKDRNAPGGAVPTDKDNPY